MANEQLSNVVDMDCVKSQSPLAFGLTSAFVTGPAAILRRILWRWCQQLGYVTYAEDLGIPTPLLDIDGATFSRADLTGLRGQLAKQAMSEAFVTGTSVKLTLSDAGLLTVKAVITMTDGGDYLLEVQSALAVNQLGGYQFPASAIAAYINFLQGS